MVGWKMNTETQLWLCLMQETGSQEDRASCEGSRLSADNEIPASFDFAELEGYESTFGIKNTLLFNSHYLEVQSVISGTF